MSTIQMSRSGGRTWFKFIPHDTAQVFYNLKKKLSFKKNNLILRNKSLRSNIFYNFIIDFVYLNHVKMILNYILKNYEFSLIWVMLGHVWLCWAMLGHVWPCWVVLGHVQY